MSIQQEVTQGWLREARSTLERRGWAKEVKPQA